MDPGSGLASCAWMREARPDRSVVAWVIELKGAYMRKAMFAVLVLTLATNTAQAGMTIGKLAEVCSPDGIEFPNTEAPETTEDKFSQEFGKAFVGGFSQLICMTYIQGMRDGATYAKEGFPSDVVAKYINSCPSPKGVDMKQRVAVFNKWAGEHPERWHEPAAAGWFASGYDAFCKQ